MSFMYLFKSYIQTLTEEKKQKYTIPSSRICSFVRVPFLHKFYHSKVFQLFQKECKNAFFKNSCVF